MKYLLTLQLTKHKDAHKFQYLYTTKKNEDVQGIKESVCMEMEEKFGTPIKCVKIKEIE